MKTNKLVETGQQESLTTGQPLGENSASDNTEAKMEWESFEDRQNPGDWRVEATDFDNEGVVYVAIFSGPESRERAEEYAAMKNSLESRLARIAS
jgi:hypothetical protein